MAVFRPSNFYPNLEEIDFCELNLFTCQVNTSGTTIKAYKISLLSEDGIEIWTPPALSYDSSNPFFKQPVRNKGVLKIQEFYTKQVNLLSKVTEQNYLYYLSQIDGSNPVGFYVNNGSGAEFLPNLKNGKNYIWKLRLYEQELNTELHPVTSLPLTKVCDGFLTGSTKYVIWTKNNELLEKEKWLEISTVGPNNMFLPLDPNDDNLILPAAGESYVQREKITWVTDELGHFKDITKLELEEEMKYNYKEGTQFNIYHVSDEHTTTTVFVDPNDKIDIGATWITIYNGADDVNSRYPTNVFPMDYKDNVAIYGTNAASNVPNGQLYYFLYTNSDISVYQANYSRSVPRWELLNTSNYIKADYVTTVPSFNQDGFEDGHCYKLTTVSYIYDSVPNSDSYDGTKTYYVYADEVFEPISAVKALSYFSSSIQGELFLRRDSTLSFLPGIYLYDLNLSSDYKFTPIDKFVLDKDSKAWYNKTNELGDIGDYIAEPRKRKIIGYTDESGEIRVSESFSEIPKNNWTYRLYETQYDTYESLSSDKKLLAFSSSNRIGGTPLTSGCIITNYFGNSPYYSHTTVDSKAFAGNHVFILANIGIVSDETNDPEIVLNSGERINVHELIGLPLVGGESNINLSIDRLDDSQWMVTTPTIDAGQSAILESTLIPKKKYTVYSDFMDSMPENVIYSKNNPEITLRYNWAYKGMTQDMNTTWPKIMYDVTLPLLPDTPEKKYYKTDNTLNVYYIEWREIMFYAEWLSDDNVQIKNYYYDLYKHTGDNGSFGDSDFTKIATSDVYYDNSCTWAFHGFDLGKPPTGVGTDYLANGYKIVIHIEDEYGSVRTVLNLFFVKYDTNDEDINVTQKYNAEEKAIEVSVTLPQQVMSYGITDKNKGKYDEDLAKPVTEDPLTHEKTYKRTVTDQENLLDGVVIIGKNQILNYAYLADAESKEEDLLGITLPDRMCFYSQFTFGEGFIEEFLSKEEESGSAVELVVWSVCHSNGGRPEIFTLKSTSFSSIFPYTTQGGAVILKKNLEFAKFKLYKGGLQILTGCFKLPNKTELLNTVALATDLDSAGYTLHTPSIFMYAILPSTRVNSVPSLPNPQTTSLQYAYVGSEESGTLYRKIGSSGNFSWAEDTETVFVMIDDTSELSDTNGKQYSYDDINVPNNIKVRESGKDSGKIFWSELNSSLPSGELNYYYLETDLTRYNNENYDALKDVWFKTLLSISEKYSEISAPQAGAATSGYFITNPSDNEEYLYCKIFGENNSIKKLKKINLFDGLNDSNIVVNDYCWGVYDGKWAVRKCTNRSVSSGVYSYTWSTISIDDDVNIYHTDPTYLETAYSYWYFPSTAELPSYYDHIDKKFYELTESVVCEITASRDE